MADVIQRRFRLPEILALLLTYDGSAKRLPASRLLLRYMVGPTASDVELASEAPRCVDAILAAHPDLGALYELELPPMELMDEWLRRRIAEYGEYLTVPRLQYTDPPSSEQDAEQDASGAGS